MKRRATRTPHKKYLIIYQKKDLIHVLYSYSENQMSVINVDGMIEASKWIKKNMRATHEYCIGVSNLTGSKIGSIGLDTLQITTNIENPNLVQSLHYLYEFANTDHSRALDLLTVPPYVMNQLRIAKQ